MQQHPGSYLERFLWTTVIRSLMDRPLMVIAYILTDGGSAALVRRTREALVDAKTHVPLRLVTNRLFPVLF